MEDQNNVCRICLNVIQSNNTFTYIDDENEHIENVGSIRGLIEFCVPELDLYVSTNPIICHQCIPSMLNVYNFKSKCLQVQEVIRNYIERNNLPDYNFVNLNCVRMDEMKIKNQVVETKFVLNPDQDGECGESSTETKELETDSMGEALLEIDKHQKYDGCDQSMLDEESYVANATVKIENNENEIFIKDNIAEAGNEFNTNDPLITDIKCEEAEIEQKPVSVELPHTSLVIKAIRPD